MFDFEHWKSQWSSLLSGYKFKGSKIKFPVKYLVSPLLAFAKLHMPIATESPRQTMLDKTKQFQTGYWKSKFVVNFVCMWVSGGKGNKKGFITDKKVSAQTGALVTGCCYTICDNSTT